MKFSRSPRFQPVAMAGGPELATPDQKSGDITLKSKGEGTYKVAPGEQLKTASAGAQAFLRFGSGAFVSGKLSPSWKRPKEPIELYEFEGCPFCRKVREATSILDIDVKYYPCPAGGPTFRPKAKQIANTFPILVDPNTGTKMSESDNIIKYLFNEYGDGIVPIPLNLGIVTTLTAGLALLPRGGAGSRYRPSKIPEKPLDIWGYEGSPFVKLVREELCSLELPHIYHSVARNSPRRNDSPMVKKWNSFQVPYLEDRNTNEAYFETKAIISYINDRYAR